MTRAILPFALLAAITLIAAGGVVSDLSQTSATSAADLPVVETIKIGDAAYGDNRYPGVCENANGDRLIIYGGPGLSYWYSYCPNAGSWSAPVPIPGQPQLNDFTCVDIEADSTGRFHCVWEEPQVAGVYGSFLNGTWTTPFKLTLLGGYDMSPGVAVRSNDEVVVVNGQVLFTSYLTKDIILYLKGKDEAQFRAPLNVTQDHESSAMPHVAVASNDHIWMVDKSDLNWVDDYLVINLIEWDETNTVVDDWISVSQQDGWCFWPQVAVNSEGRVMTTWAHTQSSDYWSRLLEPKTRQLGAMIPLRMGLSTNPWATFYNKLAAHGKEFYCAAMTPGRILYLLKFDQTTSSWTRLAQISNGAVDYFDLYSGFDKMLVAWSDFSQPANVYLTTVGVPPAGPSTKPVLTIEAAAGGTTSPAPGAYRYDPGTVVTITATPGADYEFESWSGDMTGTSPSITVTMDTAKTVKANFRAKPALTIQSSAGGTTNPVPGTYRYARGTSVAIVAAAAANYQFVSWSGDASGTAASMTLTMDGDKSIMANFTLKPVLTIQAGSGGTTNPAPGSYPYFTGDKVLVRALPNPAYKFGGWTGHFIGGSNPVSVTMDGDKTLLANFILYPASPLDLAVETGMDGSSGQKINRLAWHRNSKNTGILLEAYGIYRKGADRPDGEFTKIASVSPDTFVYEDGGLPLDRKFSYCLTTIPKDPAGQEGDRSAAVTEAGVFPPLDITCRAAVNSSLFRREKINSLSWQENPLNLDITIAQYDIYRKTADEEDSAYKLIASVAGDARAFKDRQLPVNGRFVYAIRSVDSGGAVSGWSNPGRD